MIRILRYHLGRAERFSGPASFFLWRLANPSGHLSPAALRRLVYAELEKYDSPLCRKKVPNKRLPIIYCPGSATFPRISFVE
jgi:hypothetical protein